jgi:hypothetical protein
VWAIVGLADWFWHLRILLDTDTPVYRFRPSNLPAEINRYVRGLLCFLASLPPWNLTHATLHADRIDASWAI